MVRFNELRITEDRSCLIVDVEMEQIGLFSDMYIESIYLDYYKLVDSAGMPTSKAYLLWQNEDSNQRTKGVRTSLKAYDLDKTEFDIDTFEDGLFYVTVICGGEPGDMSKLPCGTDTDRETQAVIDWKGFYQHGMNYIASMFSGCSDKCTIPAGFEEFVLLWNALKTAMAVCDWPMVTKLWNRIIRARGNARQSVFVDNACGCGL
jgi:hypothetical protein